MTSRESATTQMVEPSRRGEAQMGHRPPSVRFWHTGQSVTLFFEAGNKNENELRKELESVYACLSSSDTVIKDGKKYIALTVDS